MHIVISLIFCMYNSPLARMKFRYPDAPRIDLRDPALSILEQRGQIDVVGLKRQASVHLAASALKAIEGTGTPKVPPSATFLSDDRSVNSSVRLP